MTFHYIHLNKNAPIPLHYQLSECIKTAIERGQLVEGDRIATEEEMCRTFNISRPVVRQAYASLIQEGIIERHKGKGTFVKSKDVDGNVFMEVSSFNSEMRRLGLEPKTKVLKLEVTDENQIIMNKYDLSSDLGQKYVHIKRLRYGDDIPKVLVESFMPSDYFPGIENENFEDVSLYDVMETKYKVTVDHVVRTFEARIIRDEDVELLEVKKKSPIHFVRSSAYDSANRLIEYSIAVYPGDRNQFETTIYAKKR